LTPSTGLSVTAARSARTSFTVALPSAGRFPSQIERSSTWSGRGRGLDEGVESTRGAGVGVGAASYAVENARTGTRARVGTRKKARSMLAVRSARTDWACMSRSGEFALTASVAATRRWRTVSKAFKRGAASLCYALLSGTNAGVQRTESPCIIHRMR
jgi:hypothetical protein